MKGWAHGPIFVALQLFIAVGEAEQPCEQLCNTTKNEYN